jgi:flagellum-specific peptidoglycan hydrolase FlgJ
MTLLNSTLFITKIVQAAQQTMRDSKVPASVTISQAALESSWGTSGLATNGMNLFGIKADSSWHGPTILMPTAEYVNGQRIMVNAPFRKYADWLGSIRDHAAFLVNNKRYAPAFKASTGEQFAQAIAAAGYATDPKYADLLISIMRQHGLAQYDKVS